MSLASTASFSSFAVSDGLAVTMVKRDVDDADHEVCVSLPCARLDRWRLSVSETAARDRALAKYLPEVRLQLSGLIR